MAKRKVRSKRTRRGRKLRPATSLLPSLVSEVKALRYEFHVMAGQIRRVAGILKAEQPSIAIRQYLQSDFEEELVRQFLAKGPRTTTVLADEMKSAEVKAYPKKILRAIRRINRRASKRENVEPFHFDNPTRRWQLQLEIADGKELA